MKKIAIVTGANRGMGFEAVRQLARLDYKVILTSRDAQKGKAATDKLQAEGLDVEYHALDVTESASILTLAAHVKSKYGRLDVLVNNAGILIDGADDEAASVFKAEAETILQAFRTNTLGPMLLTQALVPLMQGNGRVVNVSSGMGQLSDMNGGWPAYRLSKTALNAVTRIFADELKNTNVKVNSVCPGWVRTDMGGPNADRTPEQGVETTIWLATLADDGPSGGFFRDRQAIAW